MYVIIKNLLPSISIDDLEEFVIPAAKGRFFQKKGTIKSLKIIELVCAKTGVSVERHGLVIVDSDSIKKRLIKSLNGQSIGNVKHSVGEYVIRHWSIDSRSGDLPFKRPTLDRRKSDRRRSGLNMIAVSQKSFSIQASRTVPSQASKPSHRVVWG